MPDHISSIPVAYKKQNAETEAFSLTPSNFQVSPSKCYFQEQCGTHSLEKPRTVNRMAITFTSKKG